MRLSFSHEYGPVSHISVSRRVLFILFIFCSANRDSEIELSTGITAIICSKSYDWFCL